MDAKELLKKVKEIELKTRRLTKNVFSGEYHSAFKGKGMTFSEVRNYQYNDDVRNIDWKVTARFNEPYVKVYEEERELSVFLIIDVSRSNEFGTGTKTKKELLLEVAAVLSFSAIANNDKIGVIFVSDKVEKFIPLQKGRKHAFRLLRELISLEPEASETNLEEGIKFFQNIVKKRSICFVLSDFLDNNNFIESMKVANSRHEMIAVKINDPGEAELMDFGLVKMQDPETGKMNWVNTSSSRVQNQYKEMFENRQQDLEVSFKRAGIDFVNLSTEGKFLLELNKLFARR